MPKQAPEFSDKQLTAVTGEGTPTEAQPGVVTWTPIYKQEEYPVLEIDLVPAGATSTPLIQSVTVTDTVATTVTITVFITKDTTGTPVYSITVEIPESGTITIYFSPDDKLPIEAAVVQVTLGAPKNPDVTNYDTTVGLVGCFEPLAATTTVAATTAATEGTTTAASSTPAGTAASTSAAPTTTSSATGATTTTTLATVTTSATSAGTTTTVLCPLQYAMGTDGTEPLLPLDKVSATKDDSSVEIQKYAGLYSPWIVSLPTAEGADVPPRMTFDLSESSPDSAPQVTSVSLTPDSNVNSVTVIFTSKEGETTTFSDLPVSQDGQIAFPDTFAPTPASQVTIVFLEPADSSIGQYSVSPDIQGCFRAETTTIITPTTTSAGSTTPSTTTVSTTGTVVTTTTPTVTATPSVGSTVVLTTVTTPIGSTAFVCPLSDQMPLQSPEFSNSVLTVIKGDASPYEAEPGRIAWKPSVTSESPVMQIDLLSATGKLTLLQSVMVTDSIAQFITVVIFDTKDTSALPIFSKTVPLPDTGSASIFLRPADGMPVASALVELILGQPKDELASNYDTTVNLVGCFERATASSTVGTTSVPGSTFSSTAPPTLSTSIQTTVTSPANVITTTVSSTTPQYCAEPFEYTECLCHKTCNDMAQSSTAVCTTPGDSACQMGCQCPEGMVINNGTCIKGADCPCYYNGKFYQFQEQVASTTEKCVSLICTVHGMIRSFDPTCALNETCTNGRVFQQCPCEKTCQQPNHVCEMALCNAGCACAAGLLWNGSACVEQPQCNCFANDVMHANNDRWKANECTLCSCTNGTQSCSEYCSITATDCKAQGKSLLNRDLQDGICCRCVSNDAHCMFENQEKPIGSKWHVGLCESYECTLSSDGIGTIVKTVTQCMECQQDEKIVFTSDRCCPYCIKTVNATTTTSIPLSTTPFSPGTTIGFSTLFTTTSSFTTTGFPTGGDIVTGSPTVPPEFEYSSTTPMSTGSTIFTSSLPPTTTGVSSRVCSEVMNGETRLPESRIEIYPSSLGTADVLRGPDASGLMATPADQPTITLLLSQPGSTNPTLLQSIVISGNVKTISVTVKKSPEGEFEPYNGGENIDVTSGTLSFTDESPDGILVYEVQLTLVEPISSDAPYAARLQVYACVNELAETTTLSGTTQPGTTTPATTLPGTTLTPPACSEVMQDESQLPNSRIELIPSTIGSPDTIRGPTADGWMAKEADEPYITIDFTGRDGASPSTLERLDFFGNLRTVYILVKTTLTGDFEQYMGGEPIDVTSGTISFAEGSDRGIPVYGLQIVPLQSIMSDLPYALRLKVYACISELAETTTVPGTTPSGTTVPATTVPGTTITSPDVEVTATVPTPTGTTPSTPLSTTAATTTPPQTDVITGGTTPGDTTVPGTTTGGITPGESTVPGTTTEVPTDVEVTTTAPTPTGTTLLTTPFTTLPTTAATTTEQNVEETTIAPTPTGTTLLTTPSTTQSTTAATTTAAPTCSEVMDGDYQLPDSRIVITPTTSGDADAFRGAGAPGWMVTPADAPTITFQLSKPLTDEPTLLERLNIYGNVKTITVSVQTSLTGELNVYKDSVDVTSGTLSFVEGTNKGILVYAVQITLLETSISNLPFAIRLQVFACVKDLAETTTASGTTTTIGGVITTTPNYEDITGTGSPTPPPFETGTTTMQPAFTTGIGFTTLPGTTLPGTTLPGTTAGSTSGTTPSPTAACSEVMTDAAKLPDDRIELNPSTLGSPSSLRGPTAEGWLATEQDEPAITINLSPLTSTEPTLLEKLVFYGNLARVSVMVKRTQSGAFEQYNAGEAIDVTSGKLSFSTGTETGILVYGVQVLLLDAIMSDLPFTVRLQVYACIPETDVVTGGTTPGDTTLPGTTTTAGTIPGESPVPGTTTTAGTTPGESTVPGTTTTAGTTPGESTVPGTPTPPAETTVPGTTTDVVTGGTTPGESTVPGTTTLPAEIGMSTVPGTTQPPGTTSSTTAPTQAPTTPCASDSQPPTDKCSYAGTVYALNSVWTDPKSVCLSCSCMEGGLTCQNLQELCDLTCSGELVKVEGQCCPVCQPKEEFCNVATVATSEALDGCTPDEPIQQTTCSGACTSTVGTSLTSSDLTSSFRACQALASEEVTVLLTCADGEKKSHTYTRITSCGCGASCMCANPAATFPFK